MTGARWRIGRDESCEFHVKNGGSDSVKMRIINKGGSYWLESQEMSMYEDDGSDPVYSGIGLKELKAPTLRRAQAAAERIYEGWVEEQIVYYSRVLEQIFGKTVWS